MVNVGPGQKSEHESEREQEDKSRHDGGPWGPPPNEQKESYTGDPRDFDWGLM